jgi:hypothetical protein
MGREVCSRTIKGWLGACLTTTAVVEAVVNCLYALAIVRGIAVPSLTDIFALLIEVPLILLVVCAFTALPAAIVIWLGESLRIRSVLFYIVASATIGSLIGAFVFRIVPWFFGVAGMLAGITYWLISGRFAGHHESGQRVGTT